MVKRKAFISFDYDNDLEIKEALMGQSEMDDSPFEITDFSITEAVDSNWKELARKKIRQSDLVIFMCGLHTDRATGVAAEMSITQEEGKPYFLLKGRRGNNVKRPMGAHRSDEMHEWTWDNLKSLIEGKKL